MSCPQCLAGDHNLCSTVQATMIGRFGGFADRVRCDWLWATPLPDAIADASAGPLFCGGITVFNPIVQCGVQPTQRVGVVGIGGLGHMALQFLNKWGCEVTAFTSSDSKRDEAVKFGAHHVTNSRDSAQLQKLAGSLDFILVTANATLDWPAMINALAPRGRLHFVGAVLEPVPVAVFSLLNGQKTVSGSPLGSPATTTKMLEFCARHSIAPTTELYPMSRINEALDRLRAGNIMARQRMILLYDISARERGLVLGTSNKTEFMLGYGTLFGDMASAINPLGDLYKTQVWQLAAALGVPAGIVEKKPTADLWSGQTDEGEFGFSYGDVDRLLFAMIDERRSGLELEAMGFDGRFVRTVQTMIKRSQFKRRPPVVAKVSHRTVNVDFRYARDWGI